MTIELDKILSYRPLPATELAKVSTSRILDLIFNHLLVHEYEEGDLKELNNLSYACKHFDWKDTYIKDLPYDGGNGIQYIHLLKNFLVNFAICNGISIPINSLNDPVLRNENGELIESHQWSGYSSQTN